MVKSFHPRRGKGRVRRKQTISEEKRRRSFDWDVPSKGLETVPKSNSVLDSFLVLDGVIQSPPGSGTGLIPLFLPRQERMASQDLIQLKTLHWEALASSNTLIALSVNDLRISSDYRLIPISLPKLYSSFCKLNSLPVYSVIILNSSKPFLLLSSGTSFFPRPTFQNQTTNYIASKDRFSPYAMLTTTIKY